MQFVATAQSAEADEPHSASETWASAVEVTPPTTVAVVEGIEAPICTPRLPAARFPETEILDAPASAVAETGTAPATVADREVKRLGLQIGCPRDRSGDAWSDRQNQTHSDEDRCDPKKWFHLSPPTLFQLTDMPITEIVFCCLR